MKIVILEDEVLARNRLLRMLDEILPDHEILGMFRSVRDTATFLLNKTVEPDLIFIDIQVEDGNSFELFELVDIKSKIVFVTAYNEYAVEAFRLNAVDYLLKPLKKYQLKEAVDKAKPVLKQSISNMIENNGVYKSRFLIRFANKLHSIQTKEIAYIYSKNKISYFQQWDGSRTASDFNLKDIEPVLNPKHFFRTNRQFIVHIDSISEMTRFGASRIKLQLRPAINEEIIISTEKTKIFKKWLEA